MSGNLHQQPQQQASKAQQVRLQLSCPALGLRQHFGVQPHPHMAQHHRHAHKQQTQGRVAARGTNARLMHLPINWLRVLDTAERSQIDQGICHQLHPIMSLLDAFKSEQQPLELVFPRKGPLDTHA